MNNFIKNHLEILNKKGFSEPVIELRALLNKTSFAKKEIILSNFNINQINLNLFKLAFKRRINREPISKIFNKKSFWKYDFFVNDKVLDPRPETEIIIEKILEYFKNKKKPLKLKAFLLLPYLRNKFQGFIMKALLVHYLNRN